MVEMSPFCLQRRDSNVAMCYPRVISTIALSFTMAALSPSPSPSSPSTCPIGSSYVKRVPWNPSACENFHSLSSNLSNCCTSHLSLIEIGFAQYLKATTNFNFPNLETSTSCVHDFQSQLNSLSLQNNFVDLCFYPHQFVMSRNVYAGIETLTKRLGQEVWSNHAS
ncbi:putative receptor-like protein kinase [Arachis hypogaea]|nr:putative receptor-like protein kinase [Arachis hypogaea]